MQEGFARVGMFLRPLKAHAELDEELQSHLALLEEENINHGMTPEEARRAARMSLGNMAELRESHRAVRGLPFLDSLFQDVRYAVRSMRRTPVFAIAAILTLSIGIGANTAIFSIVDEALFRPVDFPQPDELVNIFKFNRASQKFLSNSFIDFQEVRARTTSFRELSAFVRMPLSIGWNNANLRMPVEAVTGNFFSTLALNPVVGRMFSEKDDSTAADPVAMVSEDIADASSVGKIITVEDKPFTVVGVVPKRYRGMNLNWGETPRVWIPLQATNSVLPRFRTMKLFEDRSMRWLLVTGRMKAGVNLQQARAEVATIAAAMAREAPKENRGLTSDVFSASRAKFWPAYRTSVSRSLAIFAVASGLVLLLTCANLSNLLLSRGLARQREFAVRIAIGAGRTRLVRQLLTESLLLALPSGAAALGIAYGLSKILAHFPNAFQLPLTLDGHLDSRVLVFCMTLSFMTTMLFGLVPVWQTTRPDVLPSLKAAGGVISSGNDVLRNLLLALQVAFATILLIGAGLFGRSIVRAWSVHTGMRLDRLLTVGFSAPPPGSSSIEELRRSQSELARWLREHPIVESVTFASTLPLVGSHLTTKVSAANTVLTVDQQTIGVGFFQTMGIPLLNGRDFSPRDDAGTPKVVIVNQRLAARLWPNQNSVGQTLMVQESAMRVVGTVRNTNYSSVWDEEQPSLYVTDTQSNRLADFLVVRVKGQFENFEPTLRREWNRLTSRFPLFDFRSGDELLSLALAPQRIAAGIFGAFALMAVVLVSMGLYSVMAYAVARRTREIGIRIALGAKPTVVIWQVVGKALAPTAAGLTTGMAISLSLSRLIVAQVKGVSVYDTLTYALTAILIAIVTSLAAVIPARRSAQIDPQQALRSD